MSELDNTKTTNSTNTSDKPPALDEAKLSELIKTNVNEGISALRTELAQGNTNTNVTTEPKSSEATDFWDSIINPKIDTKVNKASLQAEAAQDQVDFYTSDEWLTEAEQWLTEDDPEKRKVEKAEIRKDLETKFKKLLDNGRGMPRTDIFKHVLGDKITKDGVKFRENIGKKHKASVDAELEKAQRGVDMSTVMADFSSDSVHKMKWEDVQSTYGGLSF